VPVKSIMIQHCCMDNGAKRMDYTNLQLKASCRNCRLGWTSEKSDSQVNSWPQRSSFCSLHQNLEFLAEAKYLTVSQIHITVLTPEI
jgi:hypothetical protein